MARWKPETARSQVDAIILMTARLEVGDWSAQTYEDGDG
jgi:hypothetical protein